LLKWLAGYRPGQWRRACPVIGAKQKFVLTHPEQTITRMFFSELTGSYDLTDAVKVSNHGYYRQNCIKNFLWQ
jgi:hypothetical protein